MSETIKVGEVWETSNGIKWRVTAVRGLDKQTGAQYWDGVVIGWRDKHFGYSVGDRRTGLGTGGCTLIPDAPAPTPTAEKPEVGRLKSDIYKIMKPAPREVTCKRCGIRFLTPNTLRDRCDVCQEQRDRKRDSEYDAIAHRKEDKRKARATRTYEELTRETRQARPTARIESDPYEAPVSARGGMVGGIWGKR